jgi:hypothetical protein
MILRVTIAILMLWPSVALAQSTPGGAEDLPRDRTQRKRIEVARVSGGSPSIDGHLDESVWETAQWVTKFVQKEPDQGEPASLDTEIAFLYDDQALYIGARMHSDDPATIGNLMTRRDDPGQAERLIVSLDTFLDRRTAYSFAVTAAGVRVDYFHPVDHEFQRDFTFDPVWTARAHVTDSGWIAEMRIPFSQLRFSRGFVLDHRAPRRDRLGVAVWRSGRSQQPAVKQAYRVDSVCSRRRHDDIGGSYRSRRPVR